MRYAQGGGLTAEGRGRRVQVRLAAVERFEQRGPAAEIAAELRVTERPVWRWRRAWEAGGLPGLASRGQAARCRLAEGQKILKFRYRPDGGLVGILAAVLHAVAVIRVRLTETAVS
jgi:hypothetical protein